MIENTRIRCLFASDKRSYDALRERLAEPDGLSRRAIRTGVPTGRRWFPLARGWASVPKGRCGATAVKAHVLGVGGEDGEVGQPVVPVVPVVVMHDVGGLQRKKARDGRAGEPLPVAPLPVVGVRLDVGHVVRNRAEVHQTRAPRTPEHGVSLTAVSAGVGDVFAVLPRHASPAQPLEDGRMGNTSPRGDLAQRQMLNAVKPDHFIGCHV